MTKKPAGSKGKTTAKADALIKGAKKGGVELSEHDLEKVTGGVKTVHTDGIGSHTGTNTTNKHLGN